MRINTMAKKVKHNAVFNTISHQSPDNSLVDGIDKAKIENYDRLAFENTKLQAQIDQCIRENSELKQQLSDMQISISSANMPNDEQYKEKINQLEEKISQLQEENDTYLLKISELSFELAKANSEKTQLSQLQQQVQKQRHVTPNMPQYYPRNNGYADWN